MCQTYQGGLDVIFPFDSATLFFGSLDGLGRLVGGMRKSRPPTVFFFETDLLVRELVRLRFFPRAWKGKPIDTNARAETDEPFSCSGLVLGLGHLDGCVSFERARLIQNINGLVNETG